MNKRILIIEDDPEILSVTTMILSEEYEVQGIERTEDILLSIKNFKPDLVLTDYMLPGMSGGQICKVIKNTKETKHIPVILMTAYHKMAVSLANLNYDAYLPKPFDIYKLISTVKKLLKQP
ncbi:response regulator [Mucilaginibacter aquaedulcis]|jgi:DNA-binding response OmpR family regulator|uniref:response regulator n=1 Tax=Mucilaginibacter aquaedulcis TaxID=1187081 RepID=UPI0025B5D315|nr:response regulator [Mucilaginibacter aquaedulcis]MDN3548700.1 response regulator [Mucilaginibacter aquaedulcis]